MFSGIPAKAEFGVLLDAAERDERLFRSLLLKAERTAGSLDVVKSYRRMIDNATRSRGFIDYDEAGAYGDELAQIVESLQELLTPEDAGALVELAEHAIERIEAALEQIDDSNGEVGGVVQELSDLHLRACEMARPEPLALAERLFDYELTSPYGICAFSAETYHGVLGDAGLRRYRELAEAEWARVKPRQSGDFADIRYYRIVSMMESLARADGNIEALAAVKARDLSSAYRYLVIAELLAQAGQPDKALHWAERGMQAFPKDTDNRLRDFLAAAYQQCGRHDEALQLTWVQFEERPSLEAYKKLHGVATALGVWPERRQRALTRLAEAIAGGVTAVGYWRPKPTGPDYSLRLAIALWEDDLDAAWEAVHAGACRQELLLSLAEKLETERADDALALYRRVIPSIVEQTNNAAYAEAVKLLRRVKGMLQARQRDRELSDYLAELRVRFKPKRNFIKLLDDVK
ncbi:MAG: DUF6880 family protein [Gammaproteobacteria bacterium]